MSSDGKLSKYLFLSLITENIIYIGYKESIENPFFKSVIFKVLSLIWSCLFSRQSFVPLLRYARVFYRFGSEITRI
jgi:hypothetical protein